MRRRSRRRGLFAGAAIGAGVAHHRAKRQQQEADDQGYADEQDETQYAPAPVDPADQVEHLAKLHESGALTDEEFAAAKAKALGI
jgi:hypothetical protein